MNRKVDERNEGSGGFASAPCFMHELDAETLGLVPESDTQTRKVNETDTDQVANGRERPQDAAGS